MSIYINGIGTVSPQMLNKEMSITEFISLDGNKMQCIEPDYKDLIPAMQLRRMSKVVRMGIASAKQALVDAGLETPDIITLGTAYGCLADTEIFLNKLLTQNESMLTPTAFIQSTHNTVGGQIALLTNCYGHNFTYVHRGHSFETSLQEAMMWIAENEDKENFSVLTGGVDELTNDSFNIISRFGTYKKAHENYEVVSEGTIAGEGANLFIASNKKTENSYAEFVDVHLCNTDDIQNELTLFLQLNNLERSDIDTCLVGVNGDTRYDELILNNISSLKNTQRLGFKKWCGEYPTSNAFAFILACLILKNESIPNELFLNEMPSSSVPKNVLIYNHYKNQYHSFILLKKI